MVSGSFWAGLTSRLALRTKRSRVIMTAVSVVLLGVAATLLLVGLRDQQHPPAPPAAQAVPLSPTAAPPTADAPATSTSTPPAKSSTASVAPHGVGSDPIQITIPSISVKSNLLLLGLNSDRTVQVPPLSDVGEAGWYKYSPTPGKVGPAVILGHIDSAQYGKGVFYDLGDVRQGNDVTVLRADHMVADFTVSRVIETPKTAFPTQEVYGNTSDSEIRLITCGGQFDSSARSYLDNIIVFATLKSLHHQ